MRESKTSSNPMHVEIKVSESKRKLRSLHIVSLLSRRVYDIGRCELLKGRYGRIATCYVHNRDCFA